MNDTPNDLFIRTILQSDIYCYPVLALWSSCFQIVWNYISLPIFWIERTWWLFQFQKLNDCPHGKQLGFSVSCGYISASLFSLGVQMTSGRVRWTKHVSARNREVYCQGMMSMSDLEAGNWCLVDILARKVDWGAFSLERKKANGRGTPALQQPRFASCVWSTSSRGNFDRHAFLGTIEVKWER